MPEFSRLLVGLAAWLLLCCCTPSVAQTVPLYGSTVARFATAEESRLRLGTRDAFVAALSEYDRAARTGNYNAVWMIAIALGIFAALINLPIREKPLARLAAA